MDYKQALHIFYVLILGVFIVGVESFTPFGRVGHSSILIGTKLYFFGGAISDKVHSNEVFYLDVSQAFNITSPPWTDLTVSAKIPFGSSWAGMSLIDINDNPTVYLFGGIMQNTISGNDTFVSNVFTFNIKALGWSRPNVNGKIPERRRSIHAVSNNKGRLYIFGGYADDLVGSPTVQYFNDMIILDTTNSLIWSYGSILNVPAKRNAHSATMLTNGVIIYIGGLLQTLEMVDINQINFYDTNLDIWSVKTAKNTNTVGSRCSHSAILAPDGNIIVYGGGKYDPAANGRIFNVELDTAILNTQNTFFEWIVPNVSSNIGKIQSLYAHTADLVGNYMIVAFGRFVPTAFDIVNLSSEIYIMDIRNYTWIDTFKVIQDEPSPSPTKPSSPSQPTLIPTPSTYVDNKNGNDTTKNVVIGVLSGIIGMSIIGFLGYKWYKKPREQILNIPGSN